MMKTEPLADQEMVKQARRATDAIHDQAQPDRVQSVADTDGVHGSAPGRPGPFKRLHMPPQYIVLAVEDVGEDLLHGLTHLSMHDSK